MPTTYQIVLDGQPADDDLHAAVQGLEVEESLDAPGAAQLTLAVNRTEDGDLTMVADPRFRPLAPVAVVAGADAGKQCVFDGVVLAHAATLPPGLAGASVRVWAHDATWLMSTEEKVREWAGVTDDAVAAAIFGEYGFAPAPANAADESPAHPESDHTLMQRGTDAQFLRTLARRTGKVFRVASADKPDARTGYFAKPSLDAPPVVELKPNDPSEPNVGALELKWDVARPTAVMARQALFTDPTPDGVAGDAAESGLTPLDERPLAVFAGAPNTAQLAAPADTAGELLMRAKAVLRDAGWFVRCECEVNAGRVNVILRAGDVVQVNGVGALHSGKYLVWGVRHAIGRDAHTMKLTLVRNAVGPEAAAGGGGLLGLL